VGLGPFADVSTPTVAAGVVLVATFLYAAYRDWKVREVDDVAWVPAALIGAVLGFGGLTLSSAAAVVSWLLVSVFVVQHLVPWDVRLEKVSQNLPGALEIVLYAGVGFVLLVIGLVDGVGNSGLPLVAIAAYLSVLFARALFEFGVLYGGADAKALMVAGLVLPVDATPLVHVPGAALTLLGFYPFTLTLLMDAALFAIAVPLLLAARNIRRGDFEFPKGFTSYRLPVADLPRRFVWLRDPTFHRGQEADDAETSEEDQQIRERQARELAANGVKVVWVTPQVPFVVLLAVGAVAGLVAGNLLFDLFALL
jgi:uncharacterized membrane protein YtjA (UPF0391 family)